MSSNGRKAGKIPKKAGVSSREAEILDQQRQLAARLSASGPAKAPAPATKRVSSSKVTVPRGAQQPKKTPKTSSALKRPSASTSSTSSTIRPQKRPAVRNKSTTLTAAAAIAAAKTRVAASAAIQSKAAAPSSAKLPSKTSVPRVNNNSGARKAPQLSQLVTATLQTSSEKETSYGRIEPDDFWRHLREWDALSQVAQTLYKQQQPQKANDEEASPSVKPLPDTFVSHGHYMAAWAPLCLAEARAQLVSEAKPSFVPVTVQTTKRDSSTMDCITVQVSRKDRSVRDSMQFFPNDLVVLIPAKSQTLVEAALKGQDATLRKHGLTGHVEYSRKSIDGLLLKVSKRWWAVVGTQDMMLWKLGSNVTALREFTALCRVESIPLRRYILGQDLVESSNKTRHANTHAMLNAMGGDGALGKGFTTYCAERFNPSQMAAISASAEEYGAGGFTLIKGPPGTGKTTTLVAVLNSLHIRQFNKYYDEVRKIAAMTGGSGNRKVALDNAVRGKPRLLVCAPSNAAVDNIILKIMENGFIDGAGKRYNPSLVRVGVGKSEAVKDVALENEVDSILSENMDLTSLETSIAGYKMELQHLSKEITTLRRKVHALAKASPWPLSKDWEIRIDEQTFEETGRVYFVNHKEQVTTYEVPPPPEPGEKQFLATAMPEYRAYTTRIVKLVESYNSITSKLERCSIIQSGISSKGQVSVQVRQQLETHILDSVHIVFTTLGTAGNRVLESAAKFEVVVVDEAAQSVEPSTLSALQLGSRHCILVGDPQQLPATIFNVSGRNTKYDRSLFQRLEEGGHKVYMLNQQYRMHPAISHFPRRIFYGGTLLDGQNVLHPDYGNPLRQVVLSKVPAFQPFTVLDLDSKEERGGTSLANTAEAHLAVHIYASLRELTGGLSAQTRVAVITPYAQQANLLRRYFNDFLGPQYPKFVEVNTVDGFQGREANIVIFSCVRAAGSQGIGFLSDVRRMNVALTRAKFFLFVIARCRSIVVNPYWRDLVEHARDTNAVVSVPMTKDPNRPLPIFPDLVNLGDQSRRQIHVGVDNDRKPPAV